MAGVCLEDEGLGELSKPQDRSCSQGCLQLFKRLLVLLVPQLGDVGPFLLLTCVALGDQVMEGTSNLREALDEASVVAGEAQKAAQSSSGRRHRPVLHSFHLLGLGAEWSKDKTQAAESIKWRPQQAYCSNQFLLVQPQTVFSTPPKSSRSRIDKRTARATGNTRYRYSKIAPLDHKMADNCVSLARTNTLSSTITKLIKTSKTSNKRYSYHLLNRINKMYTHDLFYLQQEWEAWLAPVYIQIRTTKT